MGLLTSVLVVDDELDLCALLTLYFKKRQVFVQCVHSLRDAATYLCSAVPSLVFLDNNLPDGNGIDLIREIKSISPQAVIVLSTGYDPFLVEPTAVKLGVNYCLAKPFSLQLLSRILLELEENLLR